jgi:hypothetical protein
MTHFQVLEDDGCNCCREHGRSSFASLSTSPKNVSSHRYGRSLDPQKRGNISCEGILKAKKYGNEFLSFIAAIVS